MSKQKATILFEKGTDKARCAALLKANASELMAAADVNKDRPGGQHKAFLLLPEQGLILMCCGRRQAEAEGATLDPGSAYLLIAYSWDGPVGQYIRRHMETDPHAIAIPR